MRDLAVGPLRDLQSYIGTRPENADALLHRQTHARDLCLGHRLYNWLVFGLALGSLAPNFPLTGGEDDNSDDHHLTQG